MRRCETDQEIRDQRDRAQQGEVWLERGRLNWKGKPPEWVLLLDEARAVARTALDCTPGGFQEEQLRASFPWLKEPADV